MIISIGIQEVIGILTILVTFLAALLAVAIFVIGFNYFKYKKWVKEIIAEEIKIHRKEYQSLHYKSLCEANQQAIFDFAEDRHVAIDQIIKVINYAHLSGDKDYLFKIIAQWKDDIINRTIHASVDPRYTLMDILHLYRKENKIVSEILEKITSIQPTNKI